MAESSSIIVCGQRFDVGRRVITWEDDPKISAYTPHCVSRDCIFPFAPAKGLGTMKERLRPRRLMGSDRSLPRLQQVIKQFVIHHDGMGTSRDCFRVLHDERGLSVHFLIDNNGDIYQTLDLVDCAFQAAGVNEISVGVELCSRGNKIEKGTFPEQLYRQYPREPVTCAINGHQWLSWSYTKEQYDAMIELGRALARILPGLPQVCPVGGDGEPIWATLDGDIREFAGYIGHYHVTNQKWDPGPWDFKRFIQSIRGRVFYPAIPGRDKPEIPDAQEQIDPVAEYLYKNNEEYGEGGYFPIGPLGETRLWHGGSHLRAERGTALVAPFAGKIVLARNQAEDDWSPVGSPNFVLLRHELTVGGQLIKFFTLLMHLEHEDSGKDPDKVPLWVRGGTDKRWWQDYRAGTLVAPDHTVSAGELIAHVGEAGRAGAWAGQVHIEIFSEEELGAKLQPGFWTAYDGTRGGRFCAVPQIVQPMDRDRSWTLGRTEIVQFFQRAPAREGYRKIAVKHLSEWSDNGDWELALAKVRDLAGLARAAKHKLYVEQIQPFLWWGQGGEAFGLPADKLVWGYHPVTFILWLHSQMKGKAQEAAGIKDAAAYGGKAPPPDIKDDSAEGAEGFMDDEDALFGEAAKSLDLEKLAAGYPDEK